MLLAACKIALQSPLCLGELFLVPLHRHTCIESTVNKQKGIDRQCEDEVQSCDVMVTVSGKMM